MEKYLLDKNRRILTLDDVEGKNRLKVFDKIGLESKYTDFAYALGGKLVKDGKYHVSSYQLKSNNPNYRDIVKGDFIITTNSTYYLGEGARIVTNLPYIYEQDVKTDDNGVPYVYYGEYPQTAASKKVNYYINMFEPLTGNRYAVSNTRAFCKRIEKPTDFLDHAPEYMLDDEKYVRLNVSNIRGKILLSTGLEVEQMDNVSFKVEPIKWYVDEETGLLVSDRILSASIPYDYMVNHENNVKRLVKKNKNN